MTKRDCVFCSDAASRTGEHVLPQWLLRLYEPDKFTTSVNGVNHGPELNTLMRLKLDACQTCNGWLERTYEDKAKRIVPALLGHGAAQAAVLDAARTRALAEWAVKTMLLTRHPQTRRHLGGGRLSSNAAWPLDLNLMREWRTSEKLPAGLRLWIARSHDTHGHTEMAQPSRLLLPTSSRVTWLRLGTKAGGTLHLCLGWQMPPHVHHPMVYAKTARGLWPQVPGTFDVEALPLLTTTGAHHFTRAFAVERQDDHSPQRL